MQDSSWNLVQIMINSNQNLATLEDFLIEKKKVENKEILLVFDWKIKFLTKLNYLNFIPNLKNKIN